MSPELEPQPAPLTLRDAPNGLWVVEEGVVRNGGVVIWKRGTRARDYQGVHRQPSGAWEMYPVRGDSDESWHRRPVTPFRGTITIELSN